MNSSIAPAANRVAENSLIMHEIFSWVQAKRDLRNCMVASKDSFIAAVKPLFDMVDDDVLGKIATCQVPIGRYVQYTQAITGVQLYEVGLPGSQAVRTLQNRYPDLRRIRISKVNGLQASASISISPELPMTPMDSAQEQQPLGHLSYSVDGIPFEWYIYQHVLPAAGEWSMKAMEFSALEKWNWRALRVIFGIDTRSHRLGDPDPRWDEVKSLEITVDLTKEELESFLQLFPNLTRLHLDISVRGDESSVKEIVSIILKGQPGCRPRLVDVRINVRYPSLYLDDIYSALEQLVAIEGVQRLHIQHDFSHLSTSWQRIYPERSRASQKVACVNTLADLTVEPVYRGYDVPAEAAAQYICKVIPPNISVRLSVEALKSYRDPQRGRAEWVDEVNQIIIAIRYSLHKPGFRKLEPGEEPFPVQITAPAASDDPEPVESSSGDDEAAAAGAEEGSDSEAEVDGMLD